MALINSIPSAVYRGSLVLLLFVVGGCSTTMKEVMPENQPSMLEIYRGHNEGTQGDASAAIRETVIDRPVAAGNRDLRGYTRTAGNEIDDLFPRLANPDLVMYVFPHVAGAGVPVPGYSTVFPMYGSVEYALPGEGRY